MPSSSLLGEIAWQDITVSSPERKMGAPSTVEEGEGKILIPIPLAREENGGQRERMPITTAANLELAWILQSSLDISYGVFLCSISYCLSGYL